MKFGNIRQRDRVLTDAVDKSLLTKVDRLPDAEEAGIGAAYLLVKSADGFKPGTAYIVRDIGEGLKWYDLSMSEFGHLAAPSNVWKRATSDSIALHWATPPDVPGTQFIDGIGIDEATWSHDVVVRKFGSTPETPSDGEVVGYSDVRDQYRFGDGFICLHNNLEDDADDFVYRIFSVTISGMYTGSDSIGSTWNWRSIKRAVVEGTYKDSFKLGDSFDLPYHNEFGRLTATIVAFDNAKDANGVSGRKSITFMLNTVLGNKSFDNKEQEYISIVPGNRFRSREDASYFRRTPEGDVPLVEGEDYEVGDLIETADVYMYHPCVTRWGSSESLGSDEQRFCHTAGNGNWRDSNLRQWLNMSGKQGRWYIPAAIDREVFDSPPNSQDSAAYASSDGFIDGFEDEDDTKFLESVSPVTLDTITDGFVYRHGFQYGDDGSYIGKSIISSIATVDKFWLPSFSQIYGFVQTEGDAGKIDNVGGDRGEGFVEVSEGDQFDILVPSAFWAAQGYFLDQDAANTILRKPLNGVDTQWYLRSCDQTVPSYVYVMSETTSGYGGSKVSRTNTTVSAHRPVGEGFAPIGPVVCFTVGEW